MSLYSVMLVDDEEEVIQIIMKKLDWASMGFQIVGYAHNGAEALELAEECQPRCGDDRYQNALYGRTGAEPEAEGALSFDPDHHLFRI